MPSSAAFWAVSVTLSPSVLGALEGAFRYVRDYPYLCWEQRLTKGVMASHFGELRRYLGDELVWEGHESLPERMLAEAADFQAPNGGMTYWVPEDRYASPYLSAYTALAFAWLRDRGESIPVGVEEKLDAYEIGYTGFVADRATLSAAFYLNKVKNSIFFSEVTSARYTATNPPPGWPLPAAACRNPRAPSSWTSRAHSI